MTARSWRFCAGAALFFLASSGLAQKPAADAATITLPPPVKDDHLERLVGGWAGRFESGGAKFEGAFSCSWVLNGQFLRMEQVAWGDGALHEQVWFWRPAKEGYRGWWFDSLGEQGSATGRLEGGDFVMTGLDADRSPFRSTSKFSGTDEIVLVQESGPDAAGKYVATAEGTYRRVKPGVGSLPAPPPASRPASDGDAWLEALLGAWSGAETIEETSRRIEKRFEASWTLDRQFLLVRLEAKFDPAKPAFESLAFWRADPASRRYSVCSLDAGGEVTVFAGRTDGMTLALEADDPKYGPRRTLVIRKGPDEFSNVREQDPERDGSYRRISEAVYRRRK